MDNTRALELSISTKWNRSWKNDFQIQEMEPSEEYVMSKNLFTVLFPTLQMSQHLTAVMDLRQRQHTTHINFTCLSL